MATEGQSTALFELRRRVDRINQEILALVQERGELVLAIAEVKEQLELASYDPRREEEMLRSIVRHAEGPFRPAQLRQIFRAIFRASLELQERARAAATHTTEGGGPR